MLSDEKSIMKKYTLFDATMAACKRKVNIRVSITSVLLKRILECHEARCTGGDFFDSLYCCTNTFIDVFEKRPKEDAYQYCHLCFVDKSDEEAVMEICAMRVDQRHEGAAPHYVVSLC